MLALRVGLVERFEDPKVLMTLIPLDYKANKNVLALCGAGGEEDLALSEVGSVEAERRAHAGQVTHHDGHAGLFRPNIWDPSVVFVWRSDGFGVISRTGEPSAIVPKDVAMLLEEGAQSLPEWCCGAVPVPLPFV